MELPDLKESRAGRTPSAHQLLDVCQQDSAWWEGKQPGCHIPSFLKDLEYRIVVRGLCH